MSGILGIKAPGGFDPFTLPYTIPAPGHFKNISLNNLFDVNPCPTHDCVYYTGGPFGVFADWCGGAYLSSYSSHGALIVHGGGHLPTGYQGNEVYAFNLATARWECCRNHPSLYVETDANSDGEYPDGQPFAVHTYNNAQAMPASWYGGTKGKFVRFGVAGNPAVQRGQVINLDNSPEASWARFTVNALPFGGGGFGYFASVRDDIRQGFWVNAGLSCDRICFIDRTGVVTSYTGSTSGSGVTVGLAYSPLLDVLLLIEARNDFAGHGDIPRLSILSGASPNAGWQAITWSGTGPYGVTFGSLVNASPLMSCGMEWSTILKKFVTYRGQGDTVVYFFNPPAGATTFAQLVAGTWTWTSETLVADGGAVPSQNSTPLNGHWNRFREVPLLKCFIWADDHQQPTQLFRPIGMI